MSDKEQLEISLNGDPFAIESGYTVADLLVKISNNPKATADSPQSFGAVAVELNAEIVPRDQFTTIQLKQNDAVEVVTLVGGG